MSDRDDKSNSKNESYLSDKDDKQQIKTEEQMQQMRAAMENMQTRLVQAEAALAEELAAATPTPKTASLVDTRSKGKALNFWTNRGWVLSITSSSTREQP